MFGRPQHSETMAGLMRQGAADQRRRDLAVIAAGQVPLLDRGRQRGPLGRVQRVRQATEAMQVAPGIDIQVGRQGHHPAHPRQTLGEQHGQHPAAAVSDQDEFAAAALLDESIDRHCQRVDDHLAVAAFGPVPGGAGWCARLTVIAWTGQIDSRSRVGGHQLQSQGMPWRWVACHAIAMRPGPPIPFQVDMQPLSRSRPIYTSCHCLGSHRWPGSRPGCRSNRRGGRAGYHQVAKPVPSHPCAPESVASNECLEPRPVGRRPLLGGTGTDQQDSEHDQQHSPRQPRRWDARQAFDQQRLAAPGGHPA